MHRYITWVTACYIGGAGLITGAVAQPVASPVSNCGSPDALVVVSAKNLPAVLGIPVEQVRLLHYRNEQLTPIVFQIDHRDADGRYLLDDETSADAGTRPFGAEDEIVFRLADGGERHPSSFALVEIEVQDSPSGQSGWVYVNVSDSVAHASTNTQVNYEAAEDSVETGIYKIGFSSRRPFLIDKFQWKLAGNHWSPNVLDAMKIRHQGSMFGLVSFRRTSNDYSSRLTRVKTGPLRVIRRTENRVRILWKLKTPALYVDYVMMPDSFIMDTIVDIPFDLGLFLRDVETLTTVDWRQAPVLPELSIRSPGTTSGLVVNGTMSDEKSYFNTVNGTRLSVHSAYGSVFLRLDIPDDFPIQPWLYLNDRFDIVDPPETQPGQFGNVGYRTTGWEDIDTEVHHLKFTTCMTVAEAGHGR